MGIPYLYSNIVSKNPHVIHHTPLNTCHRLFLDYNSIIHQCLNDLKKLNTPITNDEVFKSLVDYTNLIKNSCNPSDLLFIAVDGIAPLAKQNQQRKRRYLSAHTNQVIEEFKEANQIPYVHWDSNQITPGTQFMKELNDFLKLEYANDPRVIVSDSDEPGEGEHKAIQYIKKCECGISNDYDDPKKVNVIYGLDGDLIMLALTCNSPILLMREAHIFDGIKSNAFKYLNVNSLHLAISSHLGGPCNDYVAMCLLIGNDFLPNLSPLKIKQEAIEVLCSIYKKTTQKIGGKRLLLMNEHAIDATPTFSLNYEFVKLIFEELAKNEDSMMIHITNEYNAIETNHHAFHKKQSKLERFMAEIDSYPLRNKHLSHTIDPTKKNWRVDYYEHLFYDHSQSTIKHICMSYIQGLAWNVDYYFNTTEKKTGQWFYEYLYAPCISDISKYLTIMGANEFSSSIKCHNNIDIGATFKEYMQLLYVIPPTSIEIIPPALRPIMHDVQLGFSHLFPTRFKTSTYLKYQGWEILPVLPPINIVQMNRIASYVTSIMSPIEK